MNKNTGDTIQLEIDHIRQAIVDILLTPKGSRVFRREYGSDLFLFLDAPISPALLLQISSAVVFAIERWEYRVEVTKAEIMFDNSKVILNLQILYKNQTQHLLAIPLIDKS